MLQESLARVLALQTKWSSKNTAEMQERGKLVRQRLPELLAPHLDAVQAFPVPIAFATEGSDGTGRKGEIPWARVHNPLRSPNPRTGWYLVYLFAPRGDALFLSLNQGTTDLVRGSYRPKDARHWRCESPGPGRRSGASCRRIRDS